MIIKGGARGKAGNLAAHVLRTDQNERVRIVELSGVVAGTVAGALAEMAAHACGTRATKPLYHASLSPDPRAPPLTKEQWTTAIDRLEQRLGLAGCARAILEHEKAGADGAIRTHRHVVWSRTDPLTGRIVSDSLNWKIHAAVAAELEAEFCHARTRRASERPEGEDRQRRNPKDWEGQQGARTGINPREVTRLVTAIWRASDSGRSFQAGLAAAGFILARGDKPGVMVLIDAEGGLHGLGRRIEGVRAAEIKARLSDLDPASLPSVQEARARLKEKDGGKVTKGPRRATPQERGQRVSAHRGHLPKPSSLAGGKFHSVRSGTVQRSHVIRAGGKPTRPPLIPKTVKAPSIDFAIPEDRPGINPLEILDAIQKLKKAIGSGAKVEESLKRMEALYGRLMLKG